MESAESREKFGSNVRIDLKFIRHGERTTEGELTDYGREVTRQNAAPNMLEGDFIDMVKPIGSNAGPKSEGMGRALETANIYAHEIDGSAGVPRVDDRLSFESIITPMPYDHKAIYNSFLPADFADLPNKEKSLAAKEAQKQTIAHLMNLNTPEGIAYKRENAGASASLVLHYQEVAHRLNSESNVKIIAGTHGGTMEFLLQQALVHEKDGKREVGFTDLSVIGGEFSPSESYDVFIETDEQGSNKVLKVVFEAENRPHHVLTLDMEKVQELASAYEAMREKAA